jgi:hypothetical protein
MRNNMMSQDTSEPARRNTQDLPAWGRPQMTATCSRPLKPNPSRPGLVRAWRQMEDSARVADLLLPGALLVAMGAELLAPFVFVDFRFTPFFQ